MSGAQKISLSLLISVVAFSAVAVLAALDRFQAIETRFYVPRVEEGIWNQADRAAELIDEFHETNLSRFSAFTLEPAVQRAFRINASADDIIDRQERLDGIEQELGSLDVVRIVGIGGEQLHYSSLDADFTQTSGQRTYRRPDQISRDEPISLVSLSYTQEQTLLASLPDPAVILEPENNQIIYQLAALDTNGSLQGAALFYVNTSDLRTALIRAGLTGTGDVVRVVNDTGLILNAPARIVADLRREVAAAWDQIRAADGRVSITSSEWSGYEAFSVQDSRGLISIYLEPSASLEMPQALQYTLLVAVFLTTFLIVFLILNVRQDVSVVITDRIKRFQISLLREYVDNTDDMDLSRFKAELEDRREEVRREIRRGIGRVKPSQEEEVNRRIDRSWDEIIALLGSRSDDRAQVQLGTEKIEEIVSQLTERLASIEFARAGAPRPATARPAAQPGEPIDVQEVDDLEDVDELEEPEELGSLEDADELEELGSSEDGAAAPDDLDFASQGMKPVSVDEVDELDDADEVDEAGEVEEAAELDEPEEPAEIESLGDADDSEPGEPAEEVEELDELEEPEVVEDLSDPEEVEEPESASSADELDSLEPGSAPPFDEAAEVEPVELLDDADELEPSESIEEFDELESDERLVELEEPEAQEPAEIGEPFEPLELESADEVDGEGSEAVASDERTIPEDVSLDTLDEETELAWLTGAASSSDGPSRAAAVPESPGAAEEEELEELDDFESGDDSAEVADAEDLEPVEDDELTEADELEAVDDDEFETLDEFEEAELESVDELEDAAADELEMLEPDDPGGEAIAPEELSDRPTSSTTFGNGFFSFGRGIEVRLPGPAPEARERGLESAAEITEDGAGLEEVRPAEGTAAPKRGGGEARRGLIRFESARDGSTAHYEIASVSDILERLHVEQEVLEEHDGVIEIVRDAYQQPRPASSDEIRTLVYEVLGGAPAQEQSGVETLFGGDSDDLLDSFVDPSMQVERPEARSNQVSRFRFSEHGFDYDGFLAGFGDDEGAILKSLVRFTRYWNARIVLLFEDGEHALVPRYELGLAQACADQLSIAKSSGLYRNVLARRRVLFVKEPIATVEYFHGLCESESLALFERTLLLPLVFEGVTSYLMLGLPRGIDTLEAAFKRVAPYLAQPAGVPV